MPASSLAPRRSSSSRTGLTRIPSRALGPWPALLGTLMAAALVISRRPDVIVHAQLWAEDGRVYFQDAYNLGVRHALVLPQAGYFEVFPVLAAWVARFFAIADVPTVMNVLGLAVMVLPVALLLSPRAEPIARSLWIRALLATIIIVLPADVELDATIVNSGWYLVLAALVVLALAPPRRRLGRVLDGAVLLLSGLTGPFAILLAPAAWGLRRLRGRAAVPAPQALLLTVCALVQIASALVIAPHDAHNPAVEPRPHPALGATPALFAKLIGGRLLLGTIIGAANGLTAPGAFQWLAMAVAAAGLLLVARARRLDLLLLILVGLAVLGGALLNPSAPSPAWPVLAAVPVNSQRYYLVAEVGLLAALVWTAAITPSHLLRAAAAAAVAAAVLISVGHWTYPAYAQLGYARQAAAFGHARRGTAVTFLINPPPWSMTLVKR